MKKLTFKKPEWITSPGIVRLHAEVFAMAGKDPVKNCPFCGSPHVTISNTDAAFFTAKCDNCGAEASDREVSRGDGGEFKTRREALSAYRLAFDLAVESWNNRSCSPFEEVIRWRSDGKPDEGDTVLVQTSKHEIDAAFVEEGEWYWLGGGMIDGQVVFWTPMPEGIMTPARKEELS